MLQHSISWEHSRFLFVRKESLQSMKAALCLSITLLREIRATADVVRKMEEGVNKTLSTHLSGCCCFLLPARR
eukprot:767247-Hanusia_phi.AAC.3